MKKFMHYFLPISLLSLLLVLAGVFFARRSFVKQPKLQPQKHVQVIPQVCSVVELGLPQETMQVVQPEPQPDKSSTLTAMRLTEARRHKAHLQQQIADLKNQKSNHVTVRKKLRQQKRAEDKRSKKLRHERRKQQRLTRLNQAYEDGVYEHLYTMPLAVTQACPFNSSYYASINSSMSSARRSFANKGSERYLSYNLFGNDVLTLKDMVVESALLQAGDLAYADDNPLNYLADEPIKFKNIRERHQITLGFAVHAFEETLSCGFELPVVYQVHKTPIDVMMSDANRARVAADAEIIKVGGDVSAYVRKVLALRGCDIPQRDGFTGVGDLTLFGNLRILTDMVEQFFIGLKATFPTAQQGSRYRAWRNDLGNGGYPTVSLFISGVSSVGRFFNPFYSLEGTWYVPLSLKYRVPHYIRALDDGEGGFTLETPLKLVQYSGGPTAAFSVLETPFKGFAGQFDRITLQKGLQLNLRVGTSCEKFIVRAGFFDLYYDFHCKAKDSLKRTVPLSVGDASLWTDNTVELKNTLGASFAYQYEDDGRLKLGLEYGFAGKNSPKELNVNLSLAYGF